MGWTADLRTAADAGGQYSLSKWHFMRPQGPHMPITDSYVSIPPALWVRDDEGSLWTLGFDFSETEWRTGRWEYDVVRNGRKTGEFAQVIEFRQKKIIIHGAEGRRVWNGRKFV
jgi:hypothetical protein